MGQRTNHAVIDAQAALDAALGPLSRQVPEAPDADMRLGGETESIGRRKKQLAAVGQQLADTRDEGVGVGDVLEQVGGR